MSLTYRRISYQSQDNTIETSKTGTLATFRGQSDQLRQPLMVGSLPSTELVDRGIAYNINGNIVTCEYRRDVSPSVNSVAT